MDPRLRVCEGVIIVSVVERMEACGNTRVELSFENECAPAEASYGFTLALSITFLPSTYSSLLTSQTGFIFFL